MAEISTKKIVLITGANAGIGFELASQLMAKGDYHVLAGCRSIERGNAAIKELKAKNHPGTVELVHLDVTDDETIDRVAKLVERDHGKLDVLVNNAGILAIKPQLRAQMREAFDVNATGPAVMGSVFGPLLQKSTSSPAARIINLSSGVGSITRRLDTSSAMYKVNEVQYRASKSALNMVTACQHVEYGPDIKVFAYCPGFVVSAIGPYNTAENGAKPASEAVVQLVEVIEGKRDHEAGFFFHRTGLYDW